MSESVEIARLKIGQNLGSVCRFVGRVKLLCSYHPKFKYMNFPNRISYVPSVMEEPCVSVGLAGIQKPSLPQSAPQFHGQPININGERVLVRCRISLGPRICTPTSSSRLA